MTALTIVQLFEQKLNRDRKKTGSQFHDEGNLPTKEKVRVQKKKRRRKKLFRNKSGIMIDV